MKNIILLITDTFRYDNLAAKAKRPVRTPHLDEFARKRAVSVEGFYTGSFPTIPHRTDLATGRTGWPHYPWQPIQRSSSNHIAALLHQSGYVSQLLCDCPHLFKAGFHESFAAAWHNRGQEGDRPLLHLNDPIQRVMPPEKTRPQPSFRGHPLVDLHRWVNRYYESEMETFPARTGQTAVRWLEENWKAGPFFLWVDFFDPHEPWDAPEYLVRRYDPEYQGTPMLHPNYGLAEDYAPEELHNLWAHYAAEAELVDRYIGRILQKIDDLQLWDDSIVIVTSDHGISIGEHNRTGKSNINPKDTRYWPIYPEVGHVPFLIAAPGLPRGRSVDVWAQPADILPTLCELTGLQVEPEEEFHGKSFVPALKGQTDHHREYVVCGSFVNPRSGRIPKEHVTPFLVTERWGYTPVGAAGRPELYDLVADPLAEEDIAADHPQVLEDLHKLFLDHLREVGASPEVLDLWRSDAS